MLRVYFSLIDMNVMQTRMRPRRARKALLVARMQLALDVAGQSIQHFSHRCQCAIERERERKAVLNPTKGYQSQIWNDLGRNGWIHERIEASPHVCVDVPQANVFTNKWNGTVWH